MEFMCIRLCDVHRQSLTKGAFVAEMSSIQEAKMPESAGQKCRGKVAEREDSSIISSRPMDLGLRDLVSRRWINTAVDTDVRFQAQLFLLDQEILLFHSKSGGNEVTSCQALEMSVQIISEG